MYHPYLKRKYEIGPGLFPLSKDFGNGAMDQRLFQLLPEDFAEFRSQYELNCQREPLDKYVCVSPRTETAALGEVARFIATRLAEEYPEQVRVRDEGECVYFSNAWTGESLLIHPARNAVDSLAGTRRYRDAWDAMGAQVPEELGLWRLDPGNPPAEEIEAIHTKSPNHWAAQDKVGLSFAAVHAPVPHGERFVPWAVQMLEGILKKGPYTRFVWGMATDRRLNHHPVAAAGIPAAEWAGRRFSTDLPELYVRVERQVLWGLPHLNRALFTVRTYHQDLRALKRDRPEAVQSIAESIRSMTPETLKYKGLSENHEAVVDWLTS